MSSTPRARSGQRTLLGFDFGTRCIGVAVGQEITGNTQPLVTLLANNGEPRWNEIDDLVKTWGADALVVGIPLDLDGTRQEMTDRTEDFAKALMRRYQLPVFHSDERLTSMEAKNYLPANTKARQRRDDWQRKAILDQVAAQLILETWLSDPKNDRPITIEEAGPNGS
ncbi:MAG: Holliday junction resolvase RuvX [Gammaproteobacteria bacterium]|nr:MAG: Holliday junction resolvase RuvX [Gammaproteobacteria bacterium]